MHRRAVLHRGHGHVRFPRGRQLRHTPLVVAFGRTNVSHLRTVAVGVVALNTQTHQQKLQYNCAFKKLLNMTPTPPQTTRSREVLCKRSKHLLPPLQLALDVRDAAGGPLFLVVRTDGFAQKQAIALNARLPLTAVQLDGGAMAHSLQRTVLFEEGDLSQVATTKTTKKTKKTKRS